MPGERRRVAVRCGGGGVASQLHRRLSSPPAPEPEALPRLAAARTTSPSRGGRVVWLHEKPKRLSDSISLRQGAPGNPGERGRGEQAGACPAPTPPAAPSRLCAPRSGALVDQRALAHARRAHDDQGGGGGRRRPLLLCLPLRHALFGAHGWQSHQGKRPRLGEWSGKSGCAVRRAAERGGCMGARLAPGCAACRLDVPPPSLGAHLIAEQSKERIQVMSRSVLMGLLAPIGPAAGRTAAGVPCTRCGNALPES